jgi:hypothetical protein
MRNKDTILLEEAFKKVLLKEDQIDQPTQIFLSSLETNAKLMIDQIKEIATRSDMNIYDQHHAIEKRIDAFAKSFKDYSLYRNDKLSGSFSSGGSYEGGDDTNIGF